MEMPKPTEAHRRLERLVGTWTGEERMHPSPWDPEGGPAVGHVENRAALDGFAVIHDYEQERNGVVTYRGHGIYTWDAMRGHYAMHWWDSMGYPPNVFVGDFEEDVLTMTYESPQGHHRTAFDLSKDGEYSFLMEMSQDGKEWNPFMTGAYVRQG